MNEEQMIDLVKERMELIKQKGIKESLPNSNGLLVHVIPQNLLVESPLDFNNPNLNHEFILKHSFRRFSDLDSTFEKLNDGILGYTPDRQYYISFNNGLVETYKHPIEISNNFGSEFDYIKVDNVFFQIRNTLDATKLIYDKIFKCIPPFYVFVTFLGIRGTYFYSLDKK